MRRPSKKRTAEAVTHYRCKECGAVGVSFVLTEARLLHEYYDQQKGEWKTHDSEAVQGWDEPVIVRCGECDRPVLHHGSPLEVDRFDEWLEEVTRDYERRRTERAKLQEEFAEQQAKGFMWIGEREVFNRRMEELE